MRKPFKSVFKKSIIISTLLASALLLGACENKQPVYNSNFLAFGTVMKITLVGIPREKAEKVSALLESDFEKMHEMWHAWQPSPVSRVNVLIANNEAFASPPSLLPLLTRSIQLSEKSDHLFNPAIGHLIDLWGFQNSKALQRKPPADDEIMRLLKANPRMSDIIVDGFHIRSNNSQVRLDFGAIGKGYGVELAIKRLQELDVKNAIVNAGGDIGSIGSRDGHPWRIAVRSPSGQGLVALIHASGKESIFTSGNYERNFVWEGETFHHIIDPRTGKPAKGTASVTVIHPDATTADAAATALFVAGPTKWHETAIKMGIKHVMMIDTDGTIHMNPAMAARTDLQGSKHEVKISKAL